MTKEIEQKFLVPDTFEIPNNWKLSSQSVQLNHYFDTHPASVRTRFDSKTGFEIINKWTDDGQSAHNGTERHELTVSAQSELFERVFVNSNFDVDKKLEIANYYLENNVDKLLLNLGVNYLSKWSRQRTNYTYHEFTISVEKNAGYGKIIEIESTNNDKVTLDVIISYGESLGLKVLDSKLLNQMFEFYNKHWQEYYLTDKVIFEDQRFKNYAVV